MNILPTKPETLLIPHSFVLPTFGHSLSRFIIHTLSKSTRIIKLCFSFAMAAVLEALTIPRASAIPSATLAPVTGSSVSRRRSIRFSDFRGLKIQSMRSSALISSRSRLDLRGGRIVCEAHEAAVEVPAVTDSTWQSLVLQSDSPVLVEFWAPWCGPCRMLHPVIDKLAKQYAGKLKCYKVNTDVSPSIATQYGIRSIPTIIIFKNGEKKDAVIGAVPESTLTTCIDKFL